MLLSRRSALAYGPALSAFVANGLPSTALGAVRAAAVPAAPPDGDWQGVQSLVIHAGQADGVPHFTILSIPGSDTPLAAFASLSEDDYRGALETYSLRGYGPLRVNAFQTRQGLRYAAIWQFGRSTPSRVRYDMTEADFRDAAKRFRAQGYALTHIDGCDTDKGARFAAIWEKTDAPEQTLHIGLTAAQFKRQRALLTSQGLGVQRMAGYSSGGSARFAALFAPVQTEAQHAIPAAKFRARSAEMRAGGYRLTDASGYVAGRQAFVAAVWEKS